MKIYTKTGDDGTTGLLGGSRVSKTELQIEVVGGLDELNSCIGVATAIGPSKSLKDRLNQVQGWLFEMGAYVAAEDDEWRSKFPPPSQAIETLEQWMDEYESKLPPLKNFILPGGCPLGAQMHHARSICRRVERDVWRLHHQTPVEPELLVILNRLSDWLFLAARWANAQAKVSETLWKR
ncbi:MAG: cob(I)yrinic acid a,c-diamide adenosyltransferase [Armatimonadetes bacterium]|nr:cob(I)yrinic acid a,c-diamide adenosyltransferase [Armatimonadota bacterium]